MMERWKDGMTELLNNSSLFFRCFSKLSMIFRDSGCVSKRQNQGLSEYDVKKGVTNNYNV